MTSTIFLVFIIVFFGFLYKLIKGPHRVRYLILTAVFLIISYGAPGKYVSNRLEMMVNPYYMIPHESSLFTFKPTGYDKQGSGNNWIYAEDDKNYYYAGSLTQNFATDYITFSRDNRLTCEGFQKHRFETWCVTGKKSR
jgi:hypothetical protein